MPNVFNIFGNANVATSNTAKQVDRGRRLRRECAVRELDGGSAINAPRAGKTSRAEDVADNALAWLLAVAERQRVALLVTCLDGANDAANAVSIAASKRHSLRVALAVRLVRTSHRSVLVDGQHQAAAFDGRLSRVVAWCQPHDGGLAGLKTHRFV